MKIVRVTYTAKAEYSEQNQRNIQQVMDDLKALHSGNIRYSTTLAPDGVSFMHLTFFQSEDDQQVLLGLPSFRYFQEQLRANGLISPPKQEILTLVGASWDIFGA